MQCSDFTFSGSDSRFFIPSNPSITGRRPISGHRSRIFFPNTPPCNSTRFPSLSIRAKASFNEGIASSEVADGSFYDLLGISESGSLAEIKRAYKQLARKYHPDVSPPGRADEYTKRFIRVQEAYETLSDPRRRALYDRDMVGGLQVAFSARRRYDADEGVPEKSGWKNYWQAQISELKRRSVDKDSRHNLSWGARMRRQMNEQISLSQMTTSRRLADRKVERFEKNILKRGAVPETATKKGKDYPVGPLLLGFFVFVVIGSSLFQIIRTATGGGMS